MPRRCTPRRAIIGTCFCVTRDRTVKAGPQNFIPSAIGMIERSTLPLFGMPIQSNPSRMSATRRPSNSFTISSLTVFASFRLVVVFAPRVDAFEGAHDVVLPA